MKNLRGVKAKLLGFEIFCDSHHKYEEKQWFNWDLNSIRRSCAHTNVKLRIATFLQQNISKPPAKSANTRPTKH